MSELMTISPSVAAYLDITPNAVSGLEERRAQSLEAYAILDSAREAPFDNLAHLAALVCNAAAAVICFFTPDGQWIKASWASEGCAAKLNALPCHCLLYAPGTEDTSTLQNIGDAGPDLAACKLRILATAGLYAPDGLMLGSLLVLDKRERTLSKSQSVGLEKIALQVMNLLEMRRTLVGLSDANAQLGHQNMTDALTGIPNRRAYDHRLSTEVARAGRTGEALCLLLIDIDHFKTYNDEYGHQAGDAALQSAAGLLRSALRPYDFLARYGGEEFAILLPSTDLTDALMVAERMRGLIGGAEFLHRRLTVSIGVSRLDIESGARALVLAADNGLYRAKAAGRNKVVMGKLREDAVAGSARA